MPIYMVKSLVLMLPGANTSIGRRIIKGASWSIVSDVCSRGLSFLSAIIIARFLGIEEFGSFILVQSTLATVTVFAAFSMGITSGRYIAMYRTSDPLRAGRINSMSLYFSAVMGLVAAIGLALGASYLANITLNAPQLEKPLLLVAPILFFSSLSGAMSGAIAGVEAFDAFAKISWVFGVIGFIFLVVGVWQLGLIGGILGLLCGEFVRCVLVAWLAYRKLTQHGIPFLNRINLREYKILWQFSFPTVLAGAMHTPALWICQTIIARQPSGFSALGVYNAAQKWMTLVTFVPLAASAVVGPVLSHLHGNSDVSGHKRTTQKIVLYQVGLTVVPALLIGLTAPWAMSLFGKEFIGGSTVVVIMMILAPVLVVQRIYWQALLSVNRAWTNFLLWSVWACVVIAITWSLRLGGAKTLALSVLTANTVLLLTSMWAMKKAWQNSGNLE